MNKRKIISISLVVFAILLVVIYFLFFHKKSSPVLNAVPSDMIGFFEIHRVEEFEKTLNHPVFQEFNRLQIFKELSSDYSLFKNICATDKNLLFDFTQSGLLSAVGISKSQSVDYLFLLELDEAKNLKIKEFAPMINGQAAMISEHVFQREKIFELNYPASHINFSCAIVNSIFLFSTSSVLIENSILQIKKGNSIRNDKGFANVYAADNKETAFQLFINTAQLASYLTMFTDNAKFESVMRFSEFTNWLNLNLKADDTGILIDGFASAVSNGTTPRLKNLTGAFEHSAIDLVPASTSFLFQVNAEKLTETAGEKIKDQNVNLSFFDHWAPWIGNYYAVGATQLFDGEVADKYFLILPVNDTVLSQNKLKPVIASDTIKYKGLKILKLNSGDVLSAFTSMQFEDEVYGTLLKGHYIFTSNFIQLKYILDAIDFNQTLRFNPEYAEFSEQLSTGFNASAYLNFNNASEIIRDFISDENQNNFDSAFAITAHFPLIEMQFSEAGGDYLVHGFISRSTEPQQRTGLLWQTQIDAPVAMGPFTVFDRQADQNKIIVQDTMNQLYLLSGGGNLIWKKQLNEKLLGEVYDVDLYGNHKTQLLFNTAGGIYLFDMSGADVEGFPIRLTSPSVSPVMVMPTGAQDYNMFIACANQNIYGFNKNGNPLLNWNPLKGIGSVKQIEYFPARSKNYILVGSENKISILDKSGKRIKTIIPDGGLIAAYGFDDDHLFLIDGNGGLKIFTPDGQQVSTRFLSDAIISAGFEDVEGDGATDIIYIDDTGLHAINQNDSIIFESQPDEPLDASIVVPGKSGTGIINTISGKTFLFDYSGNLLNGFPVNGAVPFVTGRFAGGNQIVLITGNNNFIYAYRIE